MAIFRARGEELTVKVEGATGGYQIEPARFALGLSRLEMVDHYLTNLARAGRASGADVDALLDARSACAFVDTYTS